jgi:predicted phage-related endonuclease
LIEPSSEKILKRLAGRTDVEDALSRLDTLTQEEARMASAQALKIAQSIDDKVDGIDDRVKEVDDRVKGVDDKVNVVIDGVQIVYDSLSIIS